MRGCYSHARQANRSRKKTKRLRTMLGAVMRNIRRKCNAPDGKLATLLATAGRIYTQRKNDTDKTYSVHAPEVECISKGKVHKKYEFGCKVPVVSTTKGNWVIGIDAAHGNPYDGHTLEHAIKDAESMKGITIANIYCDKGYKGAAASLPEKNVYLSGRRNRAIRRWLKRRTAIEPIIGHMKADHRMDRNFLAGRVGDRMNAILAGCGFNLRKLLRSFFAFIFGWLLDHLSFEDDARSIFAAASPAA